MLLALSAMVVVWNDLKFKMFYRYNFCNILCFKLITSGTAIPKRHEPKSYEAGGSVDGLFLKIYISNHERTQ